MSWSAIRDEITSVLSGVSGIGTIHNYLRYATSKAEIDTLFVKSGVLNTWMHTRRAMDGQRSTNRETRLSHQWEILGYYALDDSGASELVFQALWESIETAFRTNVTLNGTAEYVTALDIQEPIGHVMFPPGDGGVLCHFAAGRFVVQEWVC
jgi:hypothetical protein